MKTKLKLLLSFIMLFACHLSKAQDVGDIVRLKLRVPVKSTQSIIAGQDKGKVFDIIGGSTKFMVISKTETEVKLQATPNYKKLTEQYQLKHKETYGKEKEDFSEYFNDKVYVISKSDFDLSAVKVEEKKRISVGLITLPFKARPQGKVSFDTEFNLNTTMNIALKHLGDYAFNFQFGAGIGSVGLNSGNASGLMDDQDQNVSTLTILSGLMLSHKNLQVGLYAGVDHINNQKNYNWDSNGNIWLAFGIGYDLFNVASANNKNEQN